MEALLKICIDFLISHIKLPRFLRKPLIFIPFLVLIVFSLGCTHFYNEGWRTKFLNEKNRKALVFERRILGETAKVAEAAAPESPELQQLPLDCPSGWTCSSFKDEDFSGWSEYKRSARNPRSIIVNGDSKFDSPPLLFKNGAPGLNFDLHLKAIPKSLSKGNIVVLQKDVWRCIIGDADYNSVSCQFEYGKEESKPIKQYLTSKGYKKIAPGREVITDINSRLTADNKIELTIKMKYLDVDNIPQDPELRFLFGVPSPDINNFKELIGVGVIDPKNENIEVEFKELRVSLPQVQN